MNTTTHTGTLLRQRMTEDMRMRKLVDKTQQAYIRAVRRLTGYLAAPRGRTTDTTQPPPIPRPVLAFKPDIGQTSVALSSEATGNTWCCPICGAPRNSGSSHSIR